MHDPGSHVTVTFEEDGPDAVLVRIDHQDLKPEEEEGLMEGWSWAIDSLRSYLETGIRIAHEDWLAQKAAER